MIIHTIVSEYDVFRDLRTRESSPRNRNGKKSKGSQAVVTDLKKVLNKKIRVN